MKVGVPKETVPGERRVALVPETIGRLGEGVDVVVESGAGVEAGFLDEVVAEDELHGRAREVATRLARLDAKAHAITKQRARAAMLEALTTAIARDDVELRAAIAQHAG